MGLEFGVFGDGVGLECCKFYFWFDGLIVRVFFCYVWFGVIIFVVMFECGCVFVLVLFCGVVWVVMECVI